MLVRYKKDSKPLLGQSTLYFMPVRTAIFMGETVDNMPSYIPEMGALLHAAQKYLCGQLPATNYSRLRVCNMLGACI
jgi:hypothetical protein